MQNLFLVSRSCLLATRSPPIFFPSPLCFWPKVGYNSLMIHIETRVRLPFLWGKAAFKKSNWTQVNLIVGPNGSGKTLLANEIATQFRNYDLDVAFLRSDRIPEDQVLAVLRNNQQVKERIESVLSGMFGKSITFREREDGSFVPMVVNRARGVEYNLKEGECHGLKEILQLLIALYNSQGDCLIFDEPELHLHPQFQLFFMKEIRKAAAEEPGKIFFLITHSPFFIDLRFPEDLMGVIVCHVNRVPTHIDQLSAEDELLFRRFLPRFNTYHKQFFFSDNQIFVEGYTDQQLFSHLLELTDSWYASVGTGIIDVGGKDELGVFCKVCSLLGTDGRIVGDLDSLFKGKLRDVVCQDPRPALWLQRKEEKQLPFYTQLFSPASLKRGITLEKLITRLERYLVDLGNVLWGLDGAAVPAEVAALVEKLREMYDKHQKVEDLDTFKTVVLQGVNNVGHLLPSLIPPHLAATIPLIRNLASLIFAAAAAARVYILPKGCIEHYYTRNKVLYMPIAGKDRLFHTEQEYMTQVQPEVLRMEYRELIEILNQACMRDSG